MIQAGAYAKVGNLTKIRSVSCQTVPASDGHFSLNVL